MPLGKSWVEMILICGVFIVILTTFTVNILLLTWICHLSFLFLRKKKLSSFTKPCNVLSMFLNFEPLKPYVFIWFVHIQKNVYLSHHFSKSMHALHFHLSDDENFPRQKFSLTKYFQIRYMRNFNLF